jgi:acetyl esterase
MRIAFLSLGVFLFLIGSCQEEKMEKYVPRTERQRIKYATPEPGTYLKPRAFLLMHKINEVAQNPESFNLPGNWFYRLFTPGMEKRLDTVLSCNELEVPVRIYYPTRECLDGNHPLILFIHGGGFAYGSVEEYDMMAGKLAEVTGMVMVSVEYRLAPEYPFPAAVNDCFAVLRWLQVHAPEIGGDTGRICVMGDSAGGNIATVLTLRCRDEHAPMPACQVLLYPGVTFVDRLYPSRVYFGLNSSRYVLGETFLRQVKSDYMGDMKNVRNPYLSPLEANLTSDLPPALIITAECDPLRDGGRDYARKLQAADVDVEHIEYSGMIHGFMSFHMILGEAVTAMEQIRDYLHDRWKKT